MNLNLNELVELVDEDDALVVDVEPLYELVVETPTPALALPVAIVSTLMQ